RQRLPGLAGVAGAVYAELALGRAAELGALERDHVGDIGVARVGADRKAEVGGQALRDLGPGAGAVIAAIGAPVSLGVKAGAGAGRAHQVVDALADFRVHVDARVVLGEDVLQTGVAWLPGCAGIVTTEDARRGDRDPHPARGFWVKDDRVDDETAGARRPAAA